MNVQMEETASFPQVKIMVVDWREWQMTATSLVSRYNLIALCLLVSLHYSALRCQGQSKPSDEVTQPGRSIAIQDSLKTTVEEVRIPVLAVDVAGRFDPTLDINDLMVKEDGVAQLVRSVYRIPATVLLVLDTGGELNVAKNVRLTREVALAIVYTLRKEDRIAVMQINNRIELVQDWTTDQSKLARSLNHKLISGKRSALAAGLDAAIGYFKGVPYGNSHLILVSDGIAPGGGDNNIKQSVNNLIAANITVHVISYTSLGLRTKRAIPTRPRVKSAVDKNLIMALPSTRFKEDPTPDLKTLMETKGGFVIDLELLFRHKEIKAELREREKEFVTLSEETGGSVWFPLSAGEMIDQATEVARSVDSNYVISYKPLRPFGSATVNDYRRVDVISRRVGLRVKARRGYVANIAR